MKHRSFFAILICLLAGPLFSQQGACDSTFSVSFTAVPVNGLTMSFVGSSSQPADGYLFDLGNGTQVYSHVVQQSYQQPGQYQVCFSAWYWNTQTQDTCWAQSCQWVTAGSQPTPCDSSFMVNYSWSSQAGTVFFQSNSGGLATNYVWSFGDGASGQGQSTQHTYNQPGQYYACVEASYWNPSTQDSCLTQQCQWVVITNQTTPCDSSFAVSYSWSPQANSVFFQSSSGGLASNYVWNFGDGSWGQGQSAQHTYTQPGQYYVCVQASYWNASTQDSCLAVQCQWVVVSNASTCDSTIASFGYAVNGNTVTLQNQSSSTSPTPGFVWNFGDGSSSTQSDPTHTYLQPGLYWICLDVYDIGNCMDSVCIQVQIGGGTPPCDTAFDAGFNWIVQGSSVSFVAAPTTPAADGYVWHFGDGTTGYSGPMAQHYYPFISTYQVCLDLWYFNGSTQDTCWANHCEWISTGVSNPCDSSLSAYFTPVNLQGFTYSFNNGTLSSDMSNTSFQWDFGSGISSTDVVPVHTYLGPGVYPICLTATLQNCTSTHCDTLVIGVVGLQEHPYSSSMLRVWPVPTRGGVSFDLAGAVSYQVFDALGRMAVSGQSSAPPHQLSLLGVAAGQYTLTVFSNSSIWHARMIKE